eukprot:300588-Prorocentrum_minimum.AAC.1
MDQSELIQPLANYNYRHLIKPSYHSREDSILPSIPDAVNGRLLWMLRAVMWMLRAMLWMLRAMMWYSGCVRGRQHCDCEEGAAIAGGQQGHRLRQRGVAPDCTVT